MGAADMEVEFFERLVFLLVIDGNLVLAERAFLVGLGFSASDVEDRPFRDIEVIRFPHHTAAPAGNCNTGFPIHLFLDIFLNQERKPDGIFQDARGLDLG